MGRVATFITTVLFEIVEYAVVPALLIWGWARWFRRPKPRTLFPILSLIGFVFATASANLALLSMLYANSIGGFAYYDPRLLKIFRCGFVFSVAAIAFGIAAVWRQSPLRWHALACGVATLLFWFSAAAGE
jgi:hypothetical protein